jgi:ankyrin repeat protein
LAFPTQRTQSAGASLGAGQRKRRNQEKNITQSIDFTSASELDTATLIRVAQAGNAVEIERLLDNGVDIEAQHVSTQRTAIAVAAHCGNPEIVRLLLRHEAKLNVRDYQSSTPLHLAASRGHCAVMEVLLLYDDIDVEAVDQSQQTALWVAADRGHLKAVELLLKKGARINVRANEQMTPLHTAARQGDKDMVDLLLRHKAHIEARDSSSMTALHHACESGQENVVDLLLNRGANIEAPGESKKSPLIVAAASGHCQLVTLLSKRYVFLIERTNPQSLTPHQESVPKGS